jgi:hypothetical protein
MMSEIVKQPVGRPKLKLEDLDPNWRQILLDSAQEGSGRVGWQCALGISNTGWLSLLANSPEFNAAVDEARLLSQNWWEEQGRRMTKGGNGNGKVWEINMQNRFRWNQKVEISGDPDAPVNISQKSTNVNVHVTGIEAAQSYMDLVTGKPKAKAE